MHRILKAALAREGGTARVRADGGAGPASVRGRSRAVERPPRDSGAASELPGAAFVHPQELHALGLETSESERRAADAERELIEWKKVAFMAQHVGDEFDALIISLVKYGFFVELTDLFVEGFVSLASLTDDFYIYRERQRAIIGQDTKRTFRLGGRVRVRLDRLDRSGNKLEFSVVN